MNEKETTRRSKFLSLVLRHEPEAAGVSLDAGGWVDVEALLKGCVRAGRAMTRAELDHVVETNAKKRFEFSADGARIRASQGHSVEVDLQYEKQVPPEVLYHGTATRFMESIRVQGLLKMQRHHVHLSAAVETASEVGRRHGKAAVLTVRAAAMQEAGFVFFRSTDGVWLVEAVPVEYLEFP